MSWNIIPALLSVSLIINILFIWYLRQMLRRFVYVCTNIDDLKSMVEIYMNHLEVVSELEMFYKDPHIEMLKQHTEDLVVQLGTYEEFYGLLASNDISNIPTELEGNNENVERSREESPQAEAQSETETAG